MSQEALDSRPCRAEADRLSALRSYGILDTAPEEAFDSIAQVAAFICQAPMAAINFLAENRQWFKAKVGIDICAPPLEDSICKEALRHPGIFVVPDARQDPLFRCKPLIIGEQQVRFYAGARLETAEGVPLGMLCVLDSKPRPEGLPLNQQQALAALAHAVMSHLELRCAKAKLEAREKRFRAIIDAIPQKIWTARSDGSVDYYNRRWYEFIGSRSEATEGNDWIDLIHPEDRERVQARWQRSAETGEEYETEYRLRRSDGAYRWTLARAKASRKKDGSIERWFGTCTDIHRTAEAEHALLASEERYRALIKASTLGVWLASPDGLIVDVWNWDELSDEHPETFLGSNWQEVLHPDDRLRTMNTWQRALSEIIPYEAEFRARIKSGEYRWVFVKAIPLMAEDGSVREWIGTLSDIHTHKQAEERLQTSEERLRLAIETTSLGIWDADLVTGRREWSDEAKAMLGLPVEAPVYWDSFLEQVHPEDRAAIEAEFFSTDAGAPLNYSGTYRILRKDTGELRWIAATGRTLLDPDGRPVRKIGTVQDITSLKQSEAALRKSEERQRLALQASRMIVWEQDLTTNYVTRSANSLSLLGIGSGPLSEFLDRIHPEDRALREHFRPGSGMRGSDTIEFRYTTPSGQLIWLGLRGEWAGPNRLIGVTFDIGDRKAAEAEIWRVANHDALTGLPNRALFQQRLEQALDAARRNGTAACLLLIDLDQFKEINDALGHDAGDAFLQETARRLKALTRDCDTVARFSGDEFALLVVEPLRLEHASRLAEIAIARLSEPFRYQGRTVASKASIGVAAFPDHDVSATELLKDADIALYEAKNQGRGRAITYSPALRTAVERRIALLGEVRDALPGGGIVPFYQPKVCLATGRIVGLEVLARWHHPGKGLVTPAYFGSAFDDPSLAVMLSERLLAKAAADLRRWLNAGLDPGRVAFNLSSAEFNLPDLTENVFRVFNEADIPPQYLEVEVTETVLLSRNPQSISAVLTRFHDKGISIALDDFGTGFASLSHLKQFPVDHIKIDRSFVRNLEKDRGDHAIVAAIVGLGRSLSMKVTAEGVETEGQAQRLRELGCDHGQGYLFSTAVDADMVPKLFLQQI